MLTKLDKTSWTNERLMLPRSKALAMCSTPSLGTRLNMGLVGCGDPVFEMRLDPDPEPGFKIWLDPDPVFHHLVGSCLSINV